MTITRRSLKRALLLRTKITLILATLFVLFSLIAWVASKAFIAPSFETLEREAAQKDALRCVEALYRDIHHMDIMCRDWASWDDTYQFAADRNQQYIKCNLVVESLTDNDLNVLYVINRNHEVLWGMAVDLITEKPIKIAELPLARWPADHPLLQHKAPEDTITGLMRTERGPLLVASRPICTSDNHGPIRGAFIFGRLLTNKLIDTLRAQTCVDMKMLPLLENISPSRGPSPGVRRLPLTNVTNVTKNTLTTETILDDLEGRPVVLLQTTTPREISKQGRAAIVWQMAILGMSGLVALLAMLLVAQRTIINPISQLINFITRIRESGALDSQVKIDQSDEVGTLAHEFNHMLQRLSEAYAQLREQSYASGRAEMAAGVLHNIRNGLSPILGYSNNIRTQLAEVRLEGITTALRERDKEGIDSQRQAELQQYLALALQHSAKALKTASDNLVQLDRQVSLIERILVEQDIFSRQQTSLEVVNLSAALDEALKLMPLGAQEAITLHRDPSLASSEPVKVGRFGFVQALANLLNNSAQATVPGRAEPINVWVRAFRDSQDHRPMVVIEIKDDGQGIAPALLERVFERGFSTKGGSGLGLH